jgi:cystathionine beta-lyase/cystathionine gamma-synthase
MQILRRYGVEVTVFPPATTSTWRIRCARRRLIFSESPTNCATILDLARVAEIGRRRRVKAVID